MERISLPLSVGDTTSKKGLSAIHTKEEKDRVTDETSAHPPLPRQLQGSANEHNQNTPQMCNNTHS